LTRKKKFDKIKHKNLKGGDKMLFKIFKNKFLVLLVGVIFYSSTAKGTDWWQVTGECELGREVIIKKGTKVKMLTQKEREMTIIEEVVLKRDRRGTLMNCQNGVFVKLSDCGNLVVILEKKVEKKIVIQREPVYIERYIERPVYVPPPPPPPPAVIYAPPPPPPIWMPPVHFYFHFEKHRYRVCPHYRPAQPNVVTKPPFLN
jgi:hypothetical protein